MKSVLRNPLQILKCALYALGLSQLIFGCVLFYFGFSNFPRLVSAYFYYIQQNGPDRLGLLQKYPSLFRIGEDFTLNTILLSTTAKILLAGICWFALAQIMEYFSSSVRDWARITKRLSLMARLLLISFILDLLTVGITLYYNHRISPAAPIPLDGILNSFGSWSLFIPRLNGAIALILCLGAYSAKRLVVEYTTAKEELELTI